MKKEKRPLVSVIIPTKNSEGKIFEKCLDSVKNQTYSPIELIIPDNNSTDNTKEIVKKYTKEIYNKGPERSSQRNFAIQKAKGEYVLSLDSDQELPKNLVEECVKEISGKDAVLIEDNGIGTTFWSKAHAFEKAIHFGDREVTSPRFFRRDKFLNIGGFDENLLVAEDLDLFMRMKQAGFKTGHTNLRFNHYEGGNLKDVWRKSFYYGTTAQNFLKKNPKRGLKIYLLYHPLAYLKNWKYFLKHPLYGSASIVRKGVTYIAGFSGMLNSSLRNNIKLQLAESVLKPDPAYLILYVTSKCNSKCKYCFYWKELNKEKNELKLEEIEKLTKGFKNLVYVSLTGGEPFLRENLDKIGYFFYKNSRTRFLVIVTNGTLSEKIRENVKSILEMCPKINLSIRISLDALGDIHDKIRGIKGNFKQVLKTLEYLKEIKKKHPNLRIIIHSTYSAYNEDHVKELYDYIKLQGIDQYEIGLIRKDSKLDEATKINLKKYIDFVNYVEKNKVKSKTPYATIFSEINAMNREVNFRTITENKMILPCVAGKKMLVIGEEGDVYPCEILKKTFGNIRDFNYNINKMLKSKNGEELRRDIVKSKCFCSWGCATLNNIVFNPKNYPEILHRVLKK
jgi:radical SAM protein with 4Fe4S-binding SPASM domain